MKIACATPTFPKGIADGVSQIRMGAEVASQQGAEIICYPESFLPGYPMGRDRVLECDPEELQSAIGRVQKIAQQNSIAIILPMDIYEEGNVYNGAYVIDQNGEVLGYQAKNQLDPSEDVIWTAGIGRKVFEINGVKIGISICHEGFRYPETVRWAARHGAKIVFHPFYGGVNEGGLLLKEWGQKEGCYYEKAQMARALENTIFIATSNYAFTYPDAATCVIDPEGNCLSYQAYGTSGIILVDIPLEKATGLLAHRFKPIIELV